MDKQFLKELKNKRKEYTNRFIEIKSSHEWENFINRVKREILDNPGQATIGISTGNDYWPRSQSGDLIEPKNLVLALQHELRLKYECNDSNVIISTQQRVHWWKYFSSKLEFIIAIVLMIGIAGFCDSMKFNAYVQNAMGLLIIILLIASIVILSNKLPAKTKHQEKELFGK